jgi:putative phosphotransacetylase
MTVTVHLSNRHVHLTTEDVEILFGTGKGLTRTKDLVQPGQFVCAETVTIRGPKGALEGVRILGPERPDTQCEILASDVYKIGVEGCPIRESGKLQDSMPVEIVGPAGTLHKPRGLIIAKRHVHMDPADAKSFDVADGELVDLHVPGERGCLFENTVVRVSPRFVLECHLDFDEGNACGFRPGMMGEIEKRQR